MILVFEMIWMGTVHAVTNSATIQVIAQAFPDQAVRVFAHHSHLQELQSDPVLVKQANVSFHRIRLSTNYQYRPQIVSFRRGMRELWTILSALRDVPSNEPCLVMLISTTPTAILAGSMLARLLRRQIGVQVGFHGNLNDAFNWRSRNPLTRAVDLYAALSKRYKGRVRFLVLENAIREALVNQVPTAAETTDVLPLPINEAEAAAAQPNMANPPIRIGLVGQATESKGVTAFLALAGNFKQTLPQRVTFHLVGYPAAGADLTAFVVLHDPLPTAWPTRMEFVEKLTALHYVCLPLQPAYYGLSASGALIDAITWLKPIIATRVPIIVDMFARFGDIGFLCDSLDHMRSTIEALARQPDQGRYNQQIANLRQLKASRLPSALASDYRLMIETGFPGLLSPSRRQLAAPVSLRG